MPIILHDNYFLYGKIVPPPPPPPPKLNIDQLTENYGRNVGITVTHDDS